MELKPGYKQTEAGVIPEDWEALKIGDIAKVIGGGAFKSRDAQQVGIRWLKIANVGVNEIRWNDESFLPEEFRLTCSGFLLKDGDYVLAMTRPILSGVLKIARLQKDDTPALLNQRVGKIENLNGGNLDFLYFLFQKESTVFAMQQSMAGTDPPNLSTKGLYSISCAIPKHKAEQAVIAKALSDVDALIESLEQLVVKKRQVKQGAMQELLTGKKRLPGLSGEWEVKSLGEIGESLIGLTYKPSDVKSDGVLVLRSSNVFEGQFRFNDNVFVQTEIPEKIMVRTGDIVICVRNGSRDLIGKCAKIDENMVGMTFGAFMAVFRTPFHNFIYHQFQSNVVKSQIHEHLGATINQITNKSLNSFQVHFPMDEVEQTAIAAILSDMDTEITGLDVKLSKARLLKQGMMQELLTGKIRLL